MTDLTIEHCQEIIRKYADEPTVCFEYNTEPYSDAILGFLGDHQKLTVKCKNEQDEVSQHEFFVKSLPKSATKFKEYVEEMGVFQKEVSFYRDVLPKLHLKQGNFAPRCLLATDTFMVLEDLQKRGFNVHKDYFEYDQWDPVLKALAKLHSASIICEENNSVGANDYRLNKEFTECLKEATFVFDINHPRGKWLRNCTKAVIDCLQLYSGCNQKIEVTSRLLKFIFNKLPDLVEPSKRFRNVVAHADLWKNNVLFRVDDDERKEAVMIDYQFVRYVPPVFDVLTTMYLNSDRDFLDCNFEALLNIYYGYFSTFLKIAGVDPNKILSVQDFLKSIEEYKMAAVIEATFFGTIIYLNEALCKEIVSNEETFQEFTYYNRSRFILREYRENHDFKYKFDTLLKRLVDITLNLQMA